MDRPRVIRVVNPGDIIVADPAKGSNADVWIESDALPTLGDISPNWGKARLFCLKGTMVMVLSVTENVEGEFDYLGLIDGKITPFGFGKT